MADWVQRTVTRNLLNTDPSRWYREYSCVQADPSTGIIYEYNGVHDDALNPSILSIYDNAFLELTLSGEDSAVENQRDRSNWNAGSNGNNAVPLPANATTPTMWDRHSVFAYDPEGYIYWIAGLSGNPTITQVIDSSNVNTGTSVITFNENITPLCTGDIVRWTTTGTLPGGLSGGTSYWIRRLSSTTATMHTTYAGAKANTGMVTLTDGGTGDHTMTRQTAASGIGNHPSDVWRLKVSSGSGQYEWEQLFPDFSYYQIPGFAMTPSAQWFPELGAVVIGCLNTDGFTNGNRTTWLYYPPDISNPGGVFERLGDYTVNNGGPEPGSAQQFAYDPVTDGGCIWMFGGGGWPTGGNQLWQFKSDKTWTQITAVNSPPPSRINHGVTFANGKLYVQGGQTEDPGTALTDFWEYDPTTNEWTEIVTDTTPTASDVTYMAFQGTHIVILNTDLEVWTYEVAAPPPSGPPKGGMMLLGVGG